MLRGFPHDDRSRLHAAEGDELWIACDSRLSGDGYLWDECPKLFPLPRRDAVAAFSGSTGQAYPLMMQFAHAVSAYRPAREGTLEFYDLIGHLERVANSVLTRLNPDPALGPMGLPQEFSSSGGAVVVGGFSRQAR